MKVGEQFQEFTYPDWDVREKGAVQEAGKWLAAKWANLEARYGRKAALSMAVAMMATLPIPGNIAAVIAVAEGVRGLSGYFGKNYSPEEQEKCMEGPNRGKPGRCPGSGAAKPGGKEKPASKPKLTNKPRKTPIKSPAYVGKPIDGETSLIPEKIKVAQKRNIDGLSPNVKASLELYTSDEEDPPPYQKLNAAMRKCPPKFECLTKKDKQFMDSVESAIRPLATPATVFRGVPNKVGKKLLEAAVQAQKTGKAFAMPSLTSTTGTADTALDFSEVGGYMIQIKAKNGAYLDHLSKWQGEDELLLSAKAKYKVVGVGDDVEVTYASLNNQKAKAKRKVLYLEEI